MKLLKTLSAVVLVLMALCFKPTQLMAVSTTEPKELRCEFRENPVGIDVSNPRFSWKFKNSEVRGQGQSAYQILLASSEDQLNKNVGDLWDSGKVDTAQNVGVRYSGKELLSEMRYYWKIKTWDKKGQPSDWSPPATFLTGKMAQKDWRGKWIGADLALRETRVSEDLLGFAAEGNRVDGEQWVQVDLGKPQRIDRIVLHPMRHNDPAAGGWINGYAFPIRFRIEISDDPKFAKGEVVADCTTQDYANPGWSPVTFDAKGRTARYVRLTVTKMWTSGPGQRFAYTLGELQIFSGANNIAAGASVDASTSVEGYGWSKKQLTDGLALCPANGGLTQEKPVHKHGAIYLQKEFELTKPVVRAVVSFSGLGFSELAIDGHKVGDYVIGPGFTDYEHRVPYLTFDVTDYFKTAGKKRLDVILADGWYALKKDPWVHKFETKPYVDLPKLILDLKLIHADGTETVISSDESWRWSTGEITRSWIAGEDIDLRLAGGKNRTWNPVIPVSAPRGELHHQKEPFNRIVEEVKPVSMKYDPVKKTCVWDFGRTINGWVRFKAKGQAGTQLQITTIPAAPGGEGAPKPQNWTSTFTLSGTEAPELYEPKFFHAGMRKVEVRGLTSEPAITDLLGCQVSSMGTPSSGFSCSDETTTALHDMVRRTVVSYTTFLPNDPMREWKAWTQDIQSMFGSAFYLFDESQVMYERWEHDLIDSQRADGNIANVAPGPVFDAYNSPWWGGCAVWLPWEWYVAYGDATLLKENYPAMKRYVDFLEDQSSKTGGLQKWGLKDWIAVEETPIALINTPAHYHYAQIVSQTAEMLGLTHDAKKYAEKAQQIKDTINQNFLDPATGIYGEQGWKLRKGNGDVPGGLERLHSVWWTGDRPCTQAGQVMPLALGIVPETQRPEVEKALLSEIHAHKDKLSTGFVSTPYLLDILMDLDAETCWKMTSTHDFPSWYSMTIGSGNDLMKETWAGGAAIMPSLGGSFARWCYRGLGGIRPDESAPGFKRIIIKPAVVSALTWMKSYFDSPYGLIVSNWKRVGDQLTMEITIPVNTTATVYVPAKNASQVTESGKPVDKSGAVKFLRIEGKAAVFEIGSGHYEFKTSSN